GYLLGGQLPEVGRDVEAQSTAQTTAYRRDDSRNRERQERAIGQRRDDLARLPAEAWIALRRLDQGGAPAVRAERGNQNRDEDHQRRDQPVLRIPVPVQHPQRMRRVLAQ